jgi:hypothetical protein
LYTRSVGQPERCLWSLARTTQTQIKGTNIWASGGIRTHDLGVRTGKDSSSRLTVPGKCDWPVYRHSKNSRKSHYGMVSSGMLSRVALVRTDVSEELSASSIRVTRIGELGKTLTVTSNRRTLLRRATRRNIPEDTLLHSHRRDKLKSYKSHYRFKYVLHNGSILSSSLYDVRHANAKRLYPLLPSMPLCCDVAEMKTSRAQPPSAHFVALGTNHLFTAHNSMH